MQGEGAYGRVYKGLRGGVQDVALKQLSHTGDEQLQKFIEVGIQAFTEAHTHNPQHTRQLHCPHRLASLFPDRWSRPMVP
jgi:hypothetical protein